MFRAVALTLRAGLHSLRSSTPPTAIWVRFAREPDLLRTVLQTLRNHG